MIPWRILWIPYKPKPDAKGNSCIYEDVIHEISLERAVEYLDKKRRVRPSFTSGFTFLGSDQGRPGQSWCYRYRRWLNPGDFCEFGCKGCGWQGRNR